MLQATTKRNLRRILPFGLIWLFSGWIFLIVEAAASDNFSQLPATAIKMDLQIFLVSSIALAGVGLLTGFIELRFLDQLFSKTKFAHRLLYKFLIYTLFFMLVVLVTFPLATSLEMDVALTDHRVWEKYVQYFTSITHLSTALQLATTLVLSLFYAEISEFIGQGVLRNFFTGKYHLPQEEERIFMFLDMKSSTTIAEKLGHLAYFQLLRAYYGSFTDAIVKNEGEIYQYVGDEIIISWKLRGDQRDNRCINCFYDMQENLRKKQSWFHRQFGLVPAFKAGIHFGKVTTGEIGAIKKEILFTGDVLNATARIQGLCNSYGVDLIISAELLQRLPPFPAYTLDFLGVAQLRGKEAPMELYAPLPHCPHPAVGRSLISA